MPRDALQTSEYFDRWIEFIQTKAIAPRRSSIDAVPRAEGRAARVSDLWNDAVCLTIMRYSRGDAVTEIGGSVDQMIELLQINRDTIAAVELEPRVRQMYERLDLQSLYSSLVLLAFAVALRYPKDELSRILRLLGHAGEDALLDNVAAAIGDGGRKVAADAKFPKVYSGLIDVILAPAEQRAALLKKFVLSWYRLMKPVGWHNNHKGAEGAYFGYWCFEATLVVMLFEIDDHSLVDLQHYPGDLVRQYRQAERSR